MATLNAKQVLSNLYGLMMEINYHRPEEEVLRELAEHSDPQLEKHLLRIRQIKAKLKAQANKAQFERAIEQIKLLKERGFGELKKMIQPQEQAEFMPLFRKFEELTKEDEASIFEDQELLHLIEILKRRADESSE